MNVAEIQSFIRSLTEPLAVSAKKVAEDLERACVCLEPFKALTVTQFADFLSKADEYNRTGVLSPGSGGKSSGSTRGAKASADPDKTRAAAERMTALYNDATSDGTSFGAIDGEIKKLDREFTKDSICEIARAIGIPGIFKTKKDALEEIRRKIAGRKQSFERTQW